MHQRNTQVEGLRSIAMLCVLLFHFFCRFQEIYMDGKSSLSWPFTLFGGIGVSTFFLISGYFFANADGGINFFIRRVKKLLPTYWVALIVCFLVTNLFQLPGRTAPFSDFLFNFLLLGGFPGIVFVDGAHWFLRTMLTIIVFYAIILRMSSKKHFSVYVVTVLFVMGLFFVELNVSYLQYAAKVLLNPSGLGLEYLVVTIMGSALAFIKKNEKKGFLLFVLCFASDIVLWDVSMSIAMLLMSVLLFLCERKKMTFFEITFFQQLAKSSYSIYLLHQNIGYIIMLALLDFFPYAYWMPLLTTLCMIGVGMLLHHRVEKKINSHFKKRLSATHF